MSTKIYDGFKLRVKSLDKAFYIMQEARDAIQSAAKAEAARLLAERACAVYDAHTLSGEPLGRSALSQAYEDIETNLQHSAKHRAKSYYDLEFSVALGLTADKTVIGMMFCTNQRLRKLFKANPAFLEYGYWDNTDAPENVPRPAWAKRCGHWNEVLRKGTPAEEMFNITFVREYELPYPDKEDVGLQIIAFEKRLQDATEDVTITNAAKELNFDKPSDVLRYRMSKEYATRFDAEKLLVEQKLKKDLTLEDLLEKI